MLATISCQVWRARESSGTWEAASKAALQCLLMDWARIFRIFALSSWCTGSTTGRVAGNCRASGGKWWCWWQRDLVSAVGASVAALVVAVQDGAWFC